MKLNEIYDREEYSCKSILYPPKKDLDKNKSL